MKNIPEYKYNGARSLVLLHEAHMKSFLTTWKKAKEAKIKLPESNDLDYQSMATILFHVLRASRGYMVWICEKLNLDNPQIDTPPPLAEVKNKAGDYLNHLFERWRLPLVNVPEHSFRGSSYKTNWGDDFCIESMLEHAVLHPIRHEFQLKNMINKSKTKI
jgi:hypothetical protein